MTNHIFKKIALGFTAIVLLAACSQTNKDFSGRNNIPVLVVADDESGNSVPRSSLVHKRILSKVKSQLLRAGFTVKDGDFMMQDAGIRPHDRMSKRDIVEAVKLANSNASASNRARALILVGAYGHGRNASFADIINVRLSGDIYDLNSNNFLGGFETPERKFSSPSNCDMDCVIEVVSNNTGPLADDLGSTLSRRLSHLHGDREISKDKPTSGNKTVNLGSGSDYVFNLIGFNTEEALEIMR
ncbi:MAG: hypothetical protein R3261_13830, partial [Alphaproteobacteria bacterium]|nr:hypothetical protein [Alphaproteobacteria bacterium]